MCAGAAASIGIQMGAQAATMLLERLQGRTEPRSWTATPTISGLITATSGLTANGAITANSTAAFNGSTTFTFTDAKSGTLSYTVNGAQVVKQITRQPLENVSLAGTYGDFLSDLRGSKLPQYCFVEPRFKLGNIRELPMLDMVDSPQQRAFGQAKKDTLTAACRRCEVRFACHGGCPKDRFAMSVDGEPGQHYLCPSYKLFFGHIRPVMERMRDLLAAGFGPGFNGPLTIVVDAGTVVASLASRILGRTACDDVRDPATNKVVIKRGTLMEETHVEALHQAGIQEVKIRWDADCPVCGKDPTITELIDYELFCGVPAAQ